MQLEKKKIAELSGAVASKMRSNLILQPGVGQFVKTGIIHAPYMKTRILRVSHPFIMLNSIHISAVVIKELDGGITETHL